MRLRPGLKLNSAVSEAQVIVVRAPAGEADIRCGGEPMVAGDPPERTGAERTGAADDGEALLLGKRYSDPGGTVELLCTKPGTGALTNGDEPLTIKAAKPLPASD